MIKKIASLILTVILASCGGGGGDSPQLSSVTISTPPQLSLDIIPVSPKKMTKVFLASSENPEDFKNAPEHNLWFSFMADGNSDPSELVKVQAKSKIDTILWMGETKTIGFSSSKQYIDEAAKYSNFKYAYIYDEIFWENFGENFKISIGEKEDSILEISDYAKSKGLKPIITLMPSVLLSDNFKMKSINTYDVIAIDIYPSIIVNEYTAGCKYNDNLYTNLLYCSQKKLRNFGYKGEIWYIYQAFGINGENTQEVIKKLQLQKETINIAQQIGIDGIVPFGYYLSKKITDAEPHLYQGYGSVLDQYVR